MSLLTNVVHFSIFCRSRVMLKLCNIDITKIVFFCGGDSAIFSHHFMCYNLSKVQISRDWGHNSFDQTIAHYIKGRCIYYLFNICLLKWLPPHTMWIDQCYLIGQTTCDSHQSSLITWKNKQKEGEIRSNRYENPRCSRKGDRRSRAHVQSPWRHGFKTERKKERKIDRFIHIIL